MRSKAPRACMRACVCACVHVCVCMCVCVCVLMILLKGDLHPMQTDGGPKQNAAQDTPLTPLPKRARICRRQSLRIPSSPARLRRSTPSWRWTSFLCRRLPTCFSHISRAWHSHSFCFASAPPLRPRRPRRRRGRGSLRSPGVVWPIADGFLFLSSLLMRLLFETSLCRFTMAIHTNAHVIFTTCSCAEC